MRPQGQAHSGYYPLPQGAAKLALDYLATDDGATVMALDPCIGDGGAFKTILNGLGAKYENCWGVELTRNRAEEARQNLPGINMVAPADFLANVNKPNRAFNFIYVNAPYGDDLGGGVRFEYLFLSKCADMLRIGGVLLAVVPEQTWQDDYQFNRELNRYFVDILPVYPKPEDRPYREMLVFAYRKDHGAADIFGSPERQHKADSTPFLIPPMKHPCRNLLKESLTDDEVKEMLFSSELEALVDVPDPIKRGRPPLALGEGHNGMLVASGQAPPVVTMRDGKGRMLEIPHLVRGVSKKETILSNTEEGETEGGADFTKEIYAETFTLDITVLTHDGRVTHLQKGSSGREEIVVEVKEIYKTNDKGIMV